MSGTRLKEAYGEVNLTPKDIARVLKNFKFSNAGDLHGVDVWERSDADVEVYEDGRWEIYASGKEVMAGTNSANLSKALKGLTEAAILTEAVMSTPQDIARILTKLQLRRRPDLDDDGMESWVDQKGRGNVEVSVSESGRWVIMWEEVRATGFGLGLLAKQLIGYLSQKKRTNEGGLDELTGTGGIAGFGTPYAFAGNDEDKKKVNESFKLFIEGYGSGGLEVVKGGKVIDQLDLPTAGQYAHYKGKRYEYQRSKKTKGWYFIDLDKPLTEAGDPYYGWRNDESQTPRQKIGNAITEIHKQLKEVEKVVKRTQRLKKETGTSNNALWNRTNQALMKIEGRMHRISQTIRNMRG